MSQAKNKKTKKLKLDIASQLSKVNITIKKIEKDEKKTAEIKETKPEKKDTPQIQEKNLPEAFEQFAPSSRFTAPILLPAGQEKIDSLEAFAATTPQNISETENDLLAYSAKNKYGGGNPANSYDGGNSYSNSSGYTSSESPQTGGNGFINENPIRARPREDMQPSGLRAQTNFEDRSRLEDFTRAQEYEANKQQEERKKRSIP